MWGQFLLQGQGLDLWSLRHFCCPTLERLSSSCYLIRHEPMVEEYQWFMPYKAARGRQSFQCGTTKMPKTPKV